MHIASGMDNCAPWPSPVDAFSPSQGGGKGQERVYSCQRSKHADQSIPSPTTPCSPIPHTSISPLQPNLALASISQSDHERKGLLCFGSPVTVHARSSSHAHENTRCLRSQHTATSTPKLAQRHYLAQRVAMHNNSVRLLEPQHHRTAMVVCQGLHW
jgi:hypothetical protein